MNFEEKGTYLLESVRIFEDRKTGLIDQIDRGVCIAHPFLVALILGQWLSFLQIFEHNCNLFWLVPIVVSRFHLWDCNLENITISTLLQSCSVSSWKNRNAELETLSKTLAICTLRCSRNSLRHFTFSAQQSEFVIGILSGPHTLNTYKNHVENGQSLSSHLLTTIQWVNNQNISRKITDNWPWLFFFSCRRCVLSSTSALSFRCSPSSFTPPSILMWLHASRR